MRERERGQKRCRNTEKIGRIDSIIRIWHKTVIQLEAMWTQMYEFVEPVSNTGGIWNITCAKCRKPLSTPPRPLFSLQIKQWHTKKRQQIYAKLNIDNIRALYSKIFEIEFDVERCVCVLFHSFFRLFTLSPFPSLTHPWMALAHMCYSVCAVNIRFIFHSFAFKFSLHIISALYYTHIPCL